ncbi:TraX family protein [Latilactobacillus sakei]
MNLKMNGFQLKVLGVLTMVIDHIAEFFSFLGIPIWFHWIGRITAPIFLFESAEGFTHTSNRKKYMFRLLLGFWIMQVVTSFLNSFFIVGNELIINNIFGTLFLGTIYMQSIYYIKQGKGFIFKGISLFILTTLVSFVPLVFMERIDNNNFFLLIFKVFDFIIPTLFLTEGGMLFVLLPVLFYVFHGKKLLQVLSILIVAIISTGFNFQNLFSDNYQWMMTTSIIPIVLYNGEKGKSMRNFFYIFYPAHITVFALVSFFMR